MSETVNSKDAAFMLDTDMEQDMKSYVQEITAHAIKFINRTPKLYELLKPNKSIANVSGVCYDWAKENHEEFGDLFITELESVDWAKVARAI